MCIRDRLCPSLLLVVRKRIGIIIGMCLTAVSYVLPVELAGIDSHFHVPVFFLLLLQFHVTVYGFLDIEAFLLGNSSLVAHRGYVEDVYKRQMERRFLPSATGKRHGLPRW